MAGSIGTKKLGTQGLEVSTIGLGIMGFSGVYQADDMIPNSNAVAVIQDAIKKGVTFFDTSDYYGPHTNEVLLGQALKGLPREKVQIGTKFGHAIDEPDGVRRVRGDPEFVRKACEASLKRLDVDYIDLYYQHRVDLDTPIEVTVGELKKLVEEGKVKYIGLSEASADTIRRAHAVHPVSAIQLEWSLWEREVEEEIIPLLQVETAHDKPIEVFAFLADYEHLIAVWIICRELGIGIVPYSPLRRGFFSGKASVDTLDEKDRRPARYPRFLAANLEKNKVLYERVAALAKKYGCTPGQLALAWVTQQGDDVVPIPRTTRLANLLENIGSVNVKLGPRELKEVSAAVPQNEVAGDRSFDPRVLAYKWQTAVTPPLESWKAKQGSLRS